MNNRKEHYSAKGTYAGYDKNHKERDALDYYSTPTEEVVNILETLQLPFDKEDILLEPCAGGGHMLRGILDYLQNNPGESPHVIATDIQDRGNVVEEVGIHAGKEYDFFSDNYPYNDVDWIIMNPPYSVIEPFTMKALSIANKGVLALCRIQFLEGEGRFNKIFSQYPPSDVYVYVDRIACFKNGNVNEKVASAQAYAWFYFDLDESHTYTGTQVYWIRRANKKENTK